MVPVTTDCTESHCWVMGTIYLKNVTEKGIINVKHAKT